MTEILIGLAVGLILGCLITDAAHRIEQTVDADVLAEYDATLAVFADDAPTLRVVS